MSEVPQQKSDDELWPLLDREGLWLIYGGGVLAEEKTLRNALLHARDLLARGSSISEIISTPGNGLVLPAPQIRRLVERRELAPPSAPGRSKAKRSAKRSTPRPKTRKLTRPKSPPQQAKRAKAKPTSRSSRRKSAPKR